MNMFTYYKNILSNFLRTLHESKAGFSLVESLVAISIVTLSITSATTIVQSSLQNASVVKARSTAVALANEGIEYARNLRDNGYLAGETFEEGSFGDFVSMCTSGCSLDVLDQSTSYRVCNGDCPALGLSDSGYRIGVGNPTTFVRTITTNINQIEGENVEVSIMSEVVYRGSNRAETIALESYLLNTN